MYPEADQDVPGVDAFQYIAVSRDQALAGGWTAGKSDRIHRLLQDSPCCRKILGLNDKEREQAFEAGLLSRPTMLEVVCVLDGCELSAHAV